MISTHWWSRKFSFSVLFCCRCFWLNSEIVRFLFVLHEWITVGTEKTFLTLANVSKASLGRNEDIHIMHAAGFSLDLKQPSRQSGTWSLGHLSFYLITIHCSVFGKSLRRLCHSVRRKKFRDSKEWRNGKNTWAKTKNSPLRLEHQHVFLQHVKNKGFPFWCHLSMFCWVKVFV